MAMTRQLRPARAGDRLDAGVDQLVLRDRDADANGGTGSLGKPSSGLEQRLYVQQDANFNVTSLTDTSGGVVERYLYEAYGKRSVLNADWSADGGEDDYAMASGFQGGRHDAVTADVHFRNRDLDVELGRWKTADPLGYVDGMSRYEYVSSGPVGHVDALGLSSADPPKDIGPAVGFYNGHNSWARGGSVYPRLDANGKPTGEYTYYAPADQAWLSVAPCDVVLKPEEPTKGMTARRRWRMYSALEAYYKQRGDLAKAAEYSDKALGTLPLHPGEGHWYLSGKPGLAEWIGPSRFLNNSSQPVVVWYSSKSGGEYIILKPGECTSEDWDQGDYAWVRGHWYKARNGQSINVTDMGIWHTGFLGGPIFGDQTPVYFGWVPSKGGPPQLIDD